MRRRLFTIFSALSLLLFVAVCVLWVRSHWYWTGVTRYSRPYDSAPLHTHAVGVEVGRLIFYFERWGRGGDQGTIYRVSDSRIGFELIDPERDFLGFFHAVVYIPPDMVDSHYRVTAIPLWFIAGLLAILPLAWTAVRLQPAYRPGLCPSCGYDLRATPARCPECGLVPAAPPPPTP